MRTIRPGIPCSALVTALVAALVGPLFGVMGAAPASAAPAAGLCWDYDAKALAKLAVPGGPVACEGPHRAETFAVGTLPESFPAIAEATTRQVVAVRTSVCTEAAMRAYLGLPGTLPSRFRPVAVFPTAEQFAAGERWVRCDAVFDTGLGLGVMPKGAPAWIAENAANPLAFAFCTPSTGYSKMPSPTKTAAQECTAPTRQWVLVDRPVMGGAGAKYPGARALDKKATRACARFKNTFNGGLKDPYARGWSYIYPMQAGWNDGMRTASCWVPLKQYLDTPR